MPEKKDEPKLVLKTELYDTLNALVKYVLPGVGTLYAALAIIWGFPFGEEVTGTVAALAAFLGVIVGISKSGYKKTLPPEAETAGDLLIDVNEEGQDYLHVALDSREILDHIREHDEVKFRVKSQGRYGVHEDESQE